MKPCQGLKGSEIASKRASEAAEDYRSQALEALDSLLAGPLSGGLGARELEVHFPLIRAALRQIRSDLEQAGAQRF